MEIRTAYTFLKVAATQNFSKAAEQLGYSQSAVTVQMQNLEKELGVLLFERIGKRAYLTDKGREFIPYAEDLIRSYQIALNFSKDENDIKGVLRIGGVESVCTSILPKLLPEFYDLCPNVKVVIKSGVTEDLLKLLDANELDIVFTLDEKIYRSDLKCDHCKKEKIILVSAKDTSTVIPEVIELKEIANKPFVLTEKEAPYRKEFEKILAVNNLEINPILEIGNTETIITLLKSKIGISLLPEFTVKEDLKSGSLFEIKSDFPEIYMYLQAIFHKNKWVTKQMTIFIELIENYLEKDI